MGINRVSYFGPFKKRKPSIPSPPGQFNWIVKGLMYLTISPLKAPKNQHGMRTERRLHTISPLAFNQPARAPIKRNGCTVACRSNYYAHVWLCIMISLGGAPRLRKLRCCGLITCTASKDNNREASGKLHGIVEEGKKNTISWFQIMKLCPPHPHLPSGQTSYDITNLIPVPK